MVAAAIVAIANGKLHSTDTRIMCQKVILSLVRIPVIFWCDVCLKIFVSDKLVASIRWKSVALLVHVYVFLSRLSPCSWLRALIDAPFTAKLILNVF